MSDANRHLFGAFAPPPPPPERLLPPLPERPEPIDPPVVATTLRADEREPLAIDPPGADPAIVHDGTSFAWLDLLSVPRTVGVAERRRLLGVHRRLAPLSSFSRSLLFRVIDTDADLRAEAAAFAAALLESGGT